MTNNKSDKTFNKALDMIQQCVNKELVGKIDVDIEKITSKLINDLHDIRSFK